MSEKIPKTYSRGESMPVAARGSAKLLRKAGKLHLVAFNRAYTRLVVAEQKLLRGHKAVS
jgi:hypothetical protein